MERKLYKANADQKTRIKAAISDVLKNDEAIQFAYIFGSFIDENRPFHDIDLGVYFAGRKALQMSESAITLAIELSKTTAFPVDVRVLNNAPVSFVYNVMKGEMICEKNPDLRCKVMENTVRCYLDMQPILYRAVKEAFSS